MPTYSYRCDACQEAFDIQQSIHEAALSQCPKCKGKLTKLVGQVGVTFKGSGFYRTDNASKPKSAD